VPSRHPLSFLTRHNGGRPPEQTSADHRPGQQQTTPPPFRVGWSAPPPNGPAIEGRLRDLEEAKRTAQARLETLAAEEAELWARLEQLGREDGHVVCRCPGCGARCMVSAVTESGTSRWMPSGGGWPHCRVCIDRSLSRYAWGPLLGPRVEPVGDPTLVRRLRPGMGRTTRQLKEDGCIITRPAVDQPEEAP
jgi:hypothetical protein